MTFYFGRAGIIEVAPPMSNVAMVPNPIHQLAATSIVVPAPVFVDAASNVRHHFGRTNPQVIVQFRWRVTWGHELGRVPGIIMTGWKPDLHVSDVANQAVSDDFRGFAEGGN